MHLVVQSKYNSAAGEEGFYYRIKESYRNARGNVCVRILLNVGFIDPEPEQWRMIIRLLNERMERRKSGQAENMFPVEADEYVRKLVDKFWQEMMALTPSMKPVAMVLRDLILWFCKNHTLWYCKTIPYVWAEGLGCTSCNARCLLPELYCADSLNTLVPIPRIGISPPSKNDSCGV